MAKEKNAKERSSVKHIVDWIEFSNTPRTKTHPTSGHKTVSERNKIVGVGMAKYIESKILEDKNKSSKNKSKKTAGKRYKRK